MPEYEHAHDQFHREGSVEIPEGAIGVTTSTFSDHVTVHYLVPVEGDDA